LSKNLALLQQLEAEEASGAASTLDIASFSRNGDHFVPDLPAAVTEEVVKVVQNVFGGPNSPRVVVFSSVAPGDGCSWTCFSVAATLAAHRRGPICVVDANLRTPTLHQYVEVQREVGLVEALTQPGPLSNFTQPVNGSNLSVMLSGSVATNPLALLNSEHLATRISEMRSEYDTVLLDVAPASVYADALRFGRLADGVILVLQSNTTRRESALKVKRCFDSAGIRVLGAVLNKRTFPIPQSVYKRL
jgi:capsular exopolysaccharide synthesis family protein